MTAHNLPPTAPRQHWEPGPGPFETFGEMWDSEELPRPQTSRQRLVDLLNDVPSGELPEYRLGRHYAVCLLSALAAACEDTHKDAEEALAVADQFLRPLGEMDDPELLRDFIAGIARQLEVAVENELSPVD